MQSGFVVTEVLDTKDSYEPDRWFHTPFDPQSGRFSTSGSSSFRYPNTITAAWVLE